MLTTENSRSPLRILEESAHGAVRPGDLGVVMARAGVGKTAFLVQVGIDHALREKPTLHVAYGQELDHVQSWYDALFTHLGETTLSASDAKTAKDRLAHNRIIHAVPHSRLDPEKLADIFRLYDKGLGFVPKAILIDGYDWSAHDPASLAGEIRLLKELAATVDAELWMSVQTQRAVTSDHPKGITAPCDACEDQIDLAIFLEPEGTDVSIRLLKDHDNPTVSDTHLVLHPDTMQLAKDDQPDMRVGLPARAFTLITGSSKGAEQAFGEAAERFGVGETNFTFGGREPKRTRGLEILGEDALERGSVSPAYIRSQLHRSFPTTPTFQRIFKMIWHQIATAGEVFAIGHILDDGTVKGGTGWGVELARHFHKTVYVFDQERESWYRWTDEAWEPVAEPVIRRTRFAGTGTRFPTEAAVKAIEELFERSFG
ncbi:MAG: hypothetical protein VYE73_01735 [Acidobacteriota bacterium]|nr:hypothetical protein [Acidobacteriota bacterium]